MQINTKCNICCKLVDEEDSICCSFCCIWIHLKYSDLSNYEFDIYRKNEHLKWQCPKCTIEELPFSTLESKQTKKLFSQNHVSKKDRYLKNLKYKSHCCVCDRKNHLRNKAVPCQMCNSFIHQKCSGLDKGYLDNIKHSDLLSYWQCQTWKINLFPLTSLDDEEFFDFFRSTKKLNNTINVSMSSLKEKIPALFSVDKFNQDHTTMNLNCDYYDLDEINNLASSTLESLETSLKIFHTNICSLQGNFDELDSFLDNLLFSFDIISLSETWNSKSKTYLFDAGDIHGYQKYIGQTGTTLKSGCGMYISNKINFVPRPNLPTHFFNNENEFETLWRSY